MITREEITDFGKCWYINDENESFRFALYTYDDDRSVVYLSNVYVDERHRGKGLGNLIIDMAVDISKNMGFSCIMLKVVHRGFVHDWYERKGFSDFQIDPEDGLIWMKMDF